MTERRGLGPAALEARAEDAGQPEEVRELVASIQREFERRREERRPFELQWRLNQNFLQGNQYCDIIAQTGEVSDYPPENAWEFRAVYNQIAPIVETREAKLARVQPGLIVRPLTADSDDVANAHTATRLIKAAFAARAMPDLTRRATAWAEVCGCAFYKSVWNPRAGLRLGEAEGREVFEGDIAVTVAPAYEIFPDSCYRAGIEECASIIHARVYTRDEVEDAFGVKVEGKPMDAFSLCASGMAAAGAGFFPSMTALRGEMVEDGVLVLEWFERPTRDNPLGRHAIVAGDKCVYLGALNYRVDEYGRRGLPFIRQLCLYNPGSFWGSTVIERIIPIQRDYNAVKNRIGEYMARMAAGNMLVAQGSLVNEEALDAGIPPGTVLEYMEGSTPPSWLTTVGVPDSLFTRLTEMRREFNDISGVSEWSRNSVAPSQVSSGVALELLKEQDDTRLTLTAENVRAAIAQVGRQWLRLLRQFAREIRVTRAVGADAGDVGLLVWRGSAITSDDVVVDTDNELSQTPAQRKQMALELLGAGLFNDPDTGRMTRETRAKLMEIFKLGNWESATDADELHVARARREDIGLANEEAPEVMELDDHALHIAEHTRFALGAEYRALKARAPEMASALGEHIRAHKALLNGERAREGSEGK